MGGNNQGQPGQSVGRRLRQNVLLLASAILITLAAGECVAQLVLPAPLPWLFPQLRYRPDPDLTFVMAPNQSAFTADKPVRINSRGLRGAETSYTRVSGRRRLLVLGDSIVFGYGLKESDALPSRIEARLEERGINADVVNAGVPSYNTEQEVAYLAREGVLYAPDWVIVGFCWNDISDKSGVQVSREGWLISAGSKISAQASMPLENPRRYALRNLVKRSRLAYATTEGLRTLMNFVSPDEHAVFRGEVLNGDGTDRVRRGWHSVENAIHRLRLLGDKNKFRMVIVGFPSPMSLERDFPRSSYPSHLKEVASREDIPFIDLDSVYREVYQGHESLFIPYDGDHPNARGHDLAAQKIVETLLLIGIDPQQDRP